MTIEALTVVLNHSQAKGTEKLVLLGIANHHGEHGAWPSVSTLAHYTNMSERRVQQIIKSLEDSGELIVEAKKGAGYGKYKTNRYWIKVTCPPDCTGFPQHSQTKPASVDNPQTKPASLQDEARFVREVKPAMTKPLIEPLEETINSQFEIFWKEYPRKKEKGDARKAFVKALEKVDFDTLLNAVKVYAKSVQGVEQRFVKHSATWLNKECWADEVAPPKSEGGSIWDTIQ